MGAGMLYMHRVNAEQRILNCKKGFSHTNPIAWPAALMNTTSHVATLRLTTTNNKIQSPTFNIRNFIYVHELLRKGHNGIICSLFLLHNSSALQYKYISTSKGIVLDEGIIIFINDQ